MEPQASPSLDDIKAFLNTSKSGPSIDDIKSFLNTKPPQQPGEDIVRSAASGIARGIPTAIDVPAAALATGIEKLTGSQGTLGQLYQQNLQNGVNPQVSKVLGPEYQPQTELGTLAKGAGEAVGSLPLGGTGALAEGAPTAVGRAALAGVGGTAGGQAGKTIGGVPGQVIGTVLGGGIGAGSIGAGETAANAVGHAIVPTAAEDLVPLARRAQDFGIPLSLNQVAPSPILNTVQKISQAVPFSGAGEFQQVQRQAFNKAVAGTLGEDADKLSPEVIQGFLNRSSEGFNNILGGKTIQVPEESIRDLTSIGQKAAQNLTAPVAEIVNNRINQLKTDIGEDGTLSGDKLASFRSDLISAIPRADQGAKGYLGDVVDSVNKLAESSMSSEDAQQLSTLRNQWRNYKTVEPLLEKSPTGDINPADLQQRVAVSPYIKASRSSLGQDDLVDLARIGKQFLRVPGGSDTYEKASLGAGGTGLVGTALVNPVLGATLAAKAGAGVLANRGFQKYINQSPGLVEKSLQRAETAPLGEEPPSSPPNPSGIISKRPILGVAGLAGAGAAAALASPNNASASTLADRVKGAESSGNPNAKNPHSSATGAFQFTNSTWLEQLMKQRPELSVGRSVPEILALRKDPTLAQQIFEGYKQANGSSLKKAGLPVNDTTLYMAHVLGPTGAQKLLTSKVGTPVESVLSQQAIQANPHLLMGKKVEDVMRAIRAKLGGQKPTIAQAPDPNALTQ